MKKSYSLALGGGAARGIAHIGIYKYLEENNIQIDEVSGTSMGAIVGACIALGMTSSYIENFLEKVSFLKLIDLDFKQAFVSGNKVYQLLDSLYDGKTFNDTIFPLSIVATNVISGEKKVFREGKISDAVRASISLPMIFTPFEYLGNKYVDGGLKSNLPVGELRGNNIIAVSVIRDFGAPIKEKNSIGKLSWSKGIWGNNYEILKKTITNIMMTNEDLNIEIERTKGKNVILIAPNLSQYEYYDFLKGKDIIEIGYTEMSKTL